MSEIIDMEMPYFVSDTVECRCLKNSDCVSDALSRCFVIFLVVSPRRFFQLIHYDSITAVFVHAFAGTAYLSYLL